MYRIKFLFDGYARAVLIDAKGEFGIIPTFNKLEAGIYEEDKAKKYVEILNEQSKENGIPDMFELEKVEFFKESEKGE